MAKKKANAITRLQKFLAAIAGDTTAPEPVTNEEKLLYNIAEKANDPTDDKFIVTLTPTSETEGEMDKSNVEIYEAAMSGKSIYFAINFSGIDCIVQATLSASFPSYQYPSFNAYGIATDGQTIINLYVNPSDEESYAFTMDAVDIGGGESEFCYVNVDHNNGRVYYDDSNGNLNEQYVAGKKIVINNVISTPQGSGDSYTFYANVFDAGALNTIRVQRVAIQGITNNDGMALSNNVVEYDLSTLIVT